MAKNIYLPDDAEKAFEDMMRESGFDTPVQLFNELVRVYRYGMTGAKRGDLLMNVNPRIIDPTSDDQRKIPSAGLEHVRQQAKAKLHLVVDRKPQANVQKLAS